MEVLFDGGDLLAYLNPTMRSKGAVVLLPRRHVRTFLELSDIEAKALAVTTQHLQAAIAAAYAPDGFHAWCSMGVLAGQSQAHCHVQLVPRFRGVPYTYVRSDDLPLMDVQQRQRSAQRIREHMSPPTGVAQDSGQHRHPG